MRSRLRGIGCFVLVLLAGVTVITPARSTCTRCRTA